MRSLIAALLGLCALTCSLAADEPAQPGTPAPGQAAGAAAGQAPPAGPPPQTAPPAGALGGQPLSASAFDADPIATVCGTPITRKALLDQLLVRYGQAALEEIVNRTLAHQEVKRLGTTPTPEELEERIALKLRLSEAEIRHESQGKMGLEQLLAGKGETVEHLKAMLRTSEDFQIAVAMEKAVRFLQLTEERVEAQHILLSDLEKVKGIREQLASGADFAKLAAKESEDTNSAIHGGKLRPFILGFSGQGYAFDEAVFRQKDNELAGPVHGDGGYHLFRVLSRSPAKPGTFAEWKTQAWSSVLQEPVSGREVQLWLLRLRNANRDRIEIKVGVAGADEKGR
ncbi:MAG: peptidylprolyl isomerase [Planctomycetes bacterium]|nr:peptidylprolyl isomerase [Planctomycetota bacterium]